MCSAYHEMRHFAGLLILGVGKVVSFTGILALLNPIACIESEVSVTAKHPPPTSFLNTLAATDVYDKEREEIGGGRCSEMYIGPKESKPYRRKVF